MRVALTVPLPLFLLVVACGHASRTDAAVAGATTGGAASATGGAASATGGAASATGGAASATGGAASATGGAASATGGAASATGGTASATGGASTSAGGASIVAGGACGEPASAVPDPGVFQAPAIGPLGAFQVTFHNRCAQTVWPAWGSSGGLDNSVIDTQLWLPMSPASDRSITVYGGVREIGFWGRTGCRFDPGGGGACQTGECGGFVCPIKINSFPLSATVFVLDQGFHGGYNLGLRVEGEVCGNHECVVDVGTCSPASAVNDACGRTIACNDLCVDSSPDCCRTPGGLGCGTRHLDGGSPDVGDLVVTFCP